MVVPLAVPGVRHRTGRIARFVARTGNAVGLSQLKVYPDCFQPRGQCGPWGPLPGIAHQQHRLIYGWQRHVTTASYNYSLLAS